MELIVVPQAIAVGISPVGEGLANTAMIRITTDPRFEELQFRDEFMGVLELRFGDVTDDFLDQVDEATKAKWAKGGFAFEAITHEQAKQIIAFAQEMRDRGCLHMVVHCQAGFSRSPAVALALAEFFGLREQHEQLMSRTDRGHFSPNPTVLQRIREVTGARDRHQAQLEDVFKEIT